MNSISTGFVLRFFSARVSFQIQRVWPASM
jgi:hypothetical protein